jgi:hypothetical protein
MTSKYAWCGVLIVVLGMALAKPAEAQIINGQIGPTPNAGAIVAGIVVTAAVLVVATVVIIHIRKRERSPVVLSQDKAG